MIARGALLALLLACAACHKTEAAERPAPPSGEVWLTRDQLREQQVTLENAAERVVGTTLVTGGRVAFDDLRVEHVYSPVTGRVTKIEARLGDRVKKGQPLAIIDSPDVGMATSDVEKARADLVAAEHEVKRQKILQEDGAVSEREIETAEDNYRKNKAELSRAEQKARLFRAGANTSQGYVLTALLDGEIVNRNVYPGLEVQGQYGGGTSNELFTIGDVDEVWVLADVFEMDLARVKVGADVTISVVSYPETFTGKVDWISASLDPQTRSAKMRCTIANKEHKLKPEMFATVKIDVPGRLTLAIPRRAILHMGDSTIVYVHRGETADGKLRFARTPVIVDEDEAGDLVPVKHGVSPGEEIVVAGSLLLTSS